MVPYRALMSARVAVRTRQGTRRGLTITVGAALVALVAPLVTATAAPALAQPAAPAETPLPPFPADLASYYTQTLAWAPCDAGQCAWLTVPLDYDAPAGETIRIRVSRVPAMPGGQRLGSLVINPGGPGAGALDYPSYLAESATSRLPQAYDLVAFDPRGVGRSAPITCLTGAQTTRWLNVDGSPNTPAEEDLLMARAAGIGAGCLSRSPGIARHVGTEDTVRDMDILRQALGDPVLNWLGYSYGTYLGTLYAERFPDRVGRMVLDGAVDPALDAMGLSQGQSVGFQTALQRFARDCARRASCPYPGRPAAVINGINRLLASLDVRPMRTTAGRPLTQPLAITGLIYPMYSPYLWADLRDALAMARRGDGAGLLRIADAANGRIGPNRYDSNMTSAFYAISCWDLPAPPGQDGLRAAAQSWSADAVVPEIAAALAWGNAPCSSWYGHAARQPGPARTTTTAPILVVGTTYDPATPYAWSQALSAQLPTSTLLTYRGDGHTAYGGLSRCIDTAVEGYLVDGRPPAPGTVCR